MPIYEYQCLTCKNVAESLESMDVYSIACPDCQSLGGACMAVRMTSATKGLVRNGTPCFHPNRKLDKLS